MIGIVIVAHGGLAQELMAATQHVVGAQSGMQAISIEAEDNRAAKEREICAAADAVDQNQGVVVVTDLHGGSPANLSKLACRGKNRVILNGANLPMLIKLAKCRDKPVPDAVRAALEAGKKYMDSQTISAT